MKKHSKKKANQQFFEQIGDNKINPTLVHFKISPAIKAKNKVKNDQTIYEYDNTFESKLPFASNINRYKTFKIYI